MTSWNGEIATLKKWYEEYVRTYRTGDAELDDAVSLKSEHTFRVCREMELLCDSISLDERRGALALIAALFHDIARFEQFQKHRTFADDRSFNHGRRGAEILAESGVLSELASKDVNIVLCAIRYHNAPSLPPSLPEDEMLLCRLTRDADKLDIFRIAIEHYSNPDPRRSETVMIGISEAETISPEICKSVLGRKAVSYNAVRTVSDFKMLQIGWIFDLNFPHSLRCVRERGYVDAIGAFLPANPEVLRALQEVNHYIDDALAGKLA